MDLLNTQILVDSQYILLKYKALMNSQLISLIVIHKNWFLINNRPLYSLEVYKYMIAVER